MLRITRIESLKGKVILRLEGKLVGPWVDELKYCYEAERNNKRQLLLDLADLRFADYNGLALLRVVRESGVELAGCSPLLEEQLK